MSNFRQFVGGSLTVICMHDINGRAGIAGPRNNTTKCSSDEFTCDSGLCIALTRRCDKQFDCHDLSDETNCITICKPNEFACDSGDCIPLSKECDGTFDCPDATDELECPTG